MARNLVTRYELTGTLVAATPMHVGGTGDDLVTDMPLAVDGTGRFYIPGTSLTGPIRAWWTRMFDAEEAELLFGRTARSEKDEGHASFVRIEDAVIEDAAGAAQEIRDGVGIDRVSGSAADGIKYDRAILPRDSRFRFRLVIEVPAEVETKGLPRDRLKAAKDVNKAAEQLAKSGASFGALLTALESGQIRFGAAKTRGLGRLTLENARIAKRGLGTQADVIAILLQSRQDTPSTEKGTAQPAADIAETWRNDWRNDSRRKTEGVSGKRAVIDIEITWRPVLPVMSRSGIDGMLVDMLPLVTSTGGRMVPVIPGSSIKGVLRSHAERIWRTIAGKDAPEIDGEDASENDREDAPEIDGEDASENDRENRSKHFFKQLEQAELADLLFGSAAKGRDKPRKERIAEPSWRPKRQGHADRSPLRGLGAVSIDDCVIGKGIARKDWIDMVSHERGEEPKRLCKARELVGVTPWGDNALPVAHAAIDRWTGGAADKYLFSALELEPREPHTIAMSVDLDRIPCPADETDPLVPPHPPGKGASEHEEADYQAKKAKYDASLQEREIERERFWKAALALLVFTLRDFARRRIPLGFGVNRGLGSVAVDAIILRGPLPGASASEIELTGESFRDKVAMKRDFETVDAAWRDYWRLYREKAAPAKAPAEGEAA